MFAKPQKEHDWLHQLVGEWTSEMDCAMGPDQPRQKSKGRETVRSLGGLWTLGEGEGEMPDGTTGRTLMTLGFDPAKGRFVAANVLTLESSGPNMTGDGAVIPYRDVVTLVSPDHRILASYMPDGKGGWSEFMTAHYRRTA